MAFFCGFCLLIFSAFLRLSECQNFGSNNGNPSGNTGFISNGNSGFGSNTGSSGFVPAIQRNCLVSSIQAQPMFDQKQFEGAWRVLKRSSQDSIDPVLNNLLEIFSNSAFFNTKTHSMKARMYTMQSGPGAERIMVVSGSSTRSMSIFGMKFDFCQEIPAIYLSPRDPNQPGKFSMRFRTDELGLGFELNLDEVMNGMFGKNFFEFYVLSTDYQNYAVIWNCKRVADDGTCVENVVLVMSRGKMLTPYQEQLVKAKLATICVDYKALEDEPHLNDKC